MIIVKSKKEIDIMRKGGKILSGIMDEIGLAVAPGISTYEVDQLARKLVFSNGGTPIFEGYGDSKNPYPAAICASLNDEVVHGIPLKERTLKEGDIIKIDIGMKLEGMITDMARTLPVGKVSPDAWNITRATKASLDVGIATIRDGSKMSEYSKAVEGYLRSRGFVPVRDLVGHGVGRDLHEDPQIPNYFSGWKDVVFKEGMTLALEPMVNAGTHKIVLKPDGWTYLTADGKLSAHFEDTVVVRKGGCEILTR
jgi:methionyl aminopeptidase